MEHKSDTRFWKGLLAGIIIACAGMAIGIVGIRFYTEGRQQKQVEASSSGSSEDMTMQGKLKTLEERVSSSFLFDIDSEKLETGIYKGYVAGLDDPYSAYYTAEEYAKLNESIDGSYTGIGVVVTQNAETGVVSVVQVFETGPSEEAGLLPEDLVYKVDEIEVTGMELSEVVSHVKGKEGTSVKLTVFRESDQQYHELNVERRVVETPTVNSELLADQIGYIQILEFDQVTVQQFNQALESLNSQGIEGLIIDLRNNPGGILQGVVKMLDQLLPEGKVVYTEDKNGKGQTFYSDEEHQFTKPLTLLINGNSASAAEIFAGAVKDYQIGTLVGTKTFGKGIVQNVYPLSDGSAIKLTVSRYFTPSGVCIHGTGIEPDITVELSEEARTQKLSNHDTDNQLQQAIQTIKEKLGK